MAHRTRRFINTNALLKIVSLVLAYGVWHILSQQCIITHTFSVPVSIYNEPVGCTVEQPTHFQVTLAGKPSLLASIDPESLAIHLDGSRLLKGRNYVAISTETLFLPESITVVNYRPLPAMITVTAQELSHS